MNKIILGLVAIITMSSVASADLTDKFVSSIKSVDTYQNIGDRRFRGTGLNMTAEIGATKEVIQMTCSSSTNMSMSDRNGMTRQIDISNLVPNYYKAAKYLEGVNSKALANFLVFMNRPDSEVVMLYKKWAKKNPNLKPDTYSVLFNSFQKNEYDGINIVAVYVCRNNYSQDVTYGMNNRIYQDIILKLSSGDIMGVVDYFEQDKDYLFLQYQEEGFKELSLLKKFGRATGNEKYEIANEMIAARDAKLAILKKINRTY